MVSITNAYDTLKAKVQARGAQLAPCATPPTKKAENTAVITTVV